MRGLVKEEERRRRRRARALIGVPVSDREAIAATQRKLHADDCAGEDQ
jgi:hypothetical protein